MCVASVRCMLSKFSTSQRTDRCSDYFPLLQKTWSFLSGKKCLEISSFLLPTSDLQLVPWTVQGWCAEDSRQSVPATALGNEYLLWMNEQYKSCVGFYAFIPSFPWYSERTAAELIGQGFFLRQTQALATHDGYELQVLGVKSLIQRLH